MGRGVMPSRRRVGCLLALCFALSSAVYNLYVSSSLGLFCNLPGWHVDAIPAVISQRIYGHARDYTFLTAVGERWRENLTGFDCTSVNRAIQSVSALREPSLADYSLMGNDDKGVVDYVSLAFSVFGPRAESLPQLYFAILFVSMLALILGGGLQPSVSVLAGLLGFSHAVLIPFTAFYGQLGSFLALRYFPLLALPALCHVLLATFHPPRSVVGWMTLVAQGLVLALAVAVRFAAVSMLAPILAVGISVLLIRAFHGLTRRDPEALTSTDRYHRYRELCRTAAPAAICLVAISATAVAQQLRMATEYKRGDQIPGHVFWHSIVSGMSFSPRLMRDYEIRLDDVSIVAATGRYLVESGRDAEWVAMGGTSPGFAQIRWAAYDRAARDLLFRMCTSDPAGCASAIFVYKPWAWLRSLAWISGLQSRLPFRDRYDETVSTQARSAQETWRASDWPRPFSWQAGLVCMAAAALLSLADSRRRSTTIVLCVAFGSSILQSVVAYPAPHSIGEATILFWTSSVFAVALALACLIPRSRVVSALTAATPLTPSSCDGVGYEADDVEP